MDDLIDKAAAPADDVVLTADVAELDSFELVHLDLYTADEVQAATGGDFPAYGDFLEAERYWIECPAGMAAAILDELDDDPDLPVRLKVTSAEKGPEDRWEIDVDRAE